jgi:hypothetical protein
MLNKNVLSGRHDADPGCAGGGLSRFPAADFPNGVSPPVDCRNY